MTAGSELEYGDPVNAEPVSSALESARVLRLALNTLWDKLPPEADPAVTGALGRIHERITDMETQGLRIGGLAEFYLIIRPVSLVSPPPPDAMERITTAVRTLAELGMLVGQSDALDRDGA